MCISIAGHYLGLPWYITLPMCLHERNPQTAVQWSVSHICVTLDNAPTDEHSTDDVQVHCLQPCYHVHISFLTSAGLIVVGVLAVIGVGAGIIWAAGGFDSQKKSGK